jgi:hypothetical protein
MAQRPKLTRGQRALVVIVVAGVGLIAAIGFVGSYTAVQHLAVREGFGWFSYVLPVGIDVGITVFLALDLLLTWMRMPLALLRHLAWLLTAATIVFNAASAWPRPLATGMHAVVPVLFVAAIEAARHTVGRITQFEADQLMEGTRLGRWVLAPTATFRLWRRRQLWELRSYQEAIEMERRRLVFRARLKAVYGRGWRRKAPVDLLLVLRLANLGEPLPAFRLDVSNLDSTIAVALPGLGVGLDPVLAPAPLPAQVPEIAPSPAGDASVGGAEVPDGGQDGDRATVPAQQPTAPQAATVPAGPAAPAVGTAADRYYQAFSDYCKKNDAFPDGEQLAVWLEQEAGIRGRGGKALNAGHLRRYLPGFRARWEQEQGQSAGARI